MRRIFRLRTGVIAHVTCARRSGSVPGGDRITAHADRCIHRRGGGAVDYNPAWRRCRWQSCAVRTSQTDSAAPSNGPGFAVRGTYQTDSSAGCRQNVCIQTAHVVHLRAPVNPASDRMRWMNCKSVPATGISSRGGVRSKANSKSAPSSPCWRHLLHHLRDGLVLKYGALPGVPEERRAGAEREPVVRLVF